MTTIDEFRESLLKIISKNISETSDGLLLTVRVEEDPRETYLTIDNDELVFKTRDVENDSRCNSSLIGYLSSNLKIPLSNIDVIYGLRGSRIKTVLIKGVKREDFEKKILRYIRPI